MKVNYVVSGAVRRVMKKTKAYPNKPFLYPT